MSAKKVLIQTTARGTWCWSQRGRAAGRGRVKEQEIRYHCSKKTNSEVHSQGQKQVTTAPLPRFHIPSSAS